MVTKNLSLTKQGKIAILGVLILLIIILAVFNLVKGKNANATQENEFNINDLPAQGVVADANYRLIPILDIAAEKAERVYIDTESTPALFFATWDDSSVEVVKEIENALNQMGNLPHKPLVLVNTFLKTTDQYQAIEIAKTYQAENYITLPITVQIGPPTEFVKQVPSLVYTNSEGTHIITEKSKIIEMLNTVLALPTVSPQEEYAESVMDESIPQEKIEVK